MTKMAMIPEKCGPDIAATRATRMNITVAIQFLRASGRSA
jgi:hypothetical protein